MTDTRSGASRNANHSAVISDTIDALDAWWPPTLTPERFGRTWLAWWTIAVAEPQHALLHAVEDGELDGARPLGLDRHDTNPA